MKEEPDPIGVDHVRLIPLCEDLKLLVWVLMLFGFSVLAAPLLWFPTSLNASGRFTLVGDRRSVLGSLYVSCCGGVWTTWRPIKRISSPCDVPRQTGLTYCHHLHCDAELPDYPAVLAYRRSYSYLRTHFHPLH